MDVSEIVDARQAMIVENSACGSSSDSLKTASGTITAVVSGEICSKEQSTASRT